MPNKVIGREDYWADVYFAQHLEAALPPPSQFAAFVAQEIELDLRF